MKKLLFKLTSIKTLALIFCCFLLTYVTMVDTPATARIVDAGVAKFLALAPLSYFLANVSEDYIKGLKKKNNEEEVL